MKTKAPLCLFAIVFGIVLVCLWLLVLPALAFSAANFTVDTSLDEQDGSCSDGDCSLRDAIALTAPDDTILFDPSLAGQIIPSPSAPSSISIIT